MMLKRYAFLLAIISALCGISAGLVRVGLFNSPLPTLAQSHGALMLCGFLGAVISLERAVAVKKVWAYLAPIFSSLGALLALNHVLQILGQSFIVIASVIYVLANIFILYKQRAIFTWVLLLSSMMWLLGNVLWLSGMPIHKVVFFWLVFVILTIAGERLELSRLQAVSTKSIMIFSLILAAMVLGVLAAILPTIENARLLFCSFIALAIWLLLQDIARRTIQQQGITRYIACCLITGYCWLFVGGLIGIAIHMQLAGFLYDAFLHAILVGFVFSMIFGHAFLILPAVAKIKLQFNRYFYAPLCILHLSVFLRISGDIFNHVQVRKVSAWITLLALTVFILLTIVSKLRMISTQYTR